MSQYVLKPFQPSPSPFTIYVDSILIENQLEVNFSLTGDITSLNLPKPSEHPRRMEGLYHHTCLEVFLKRGDRYLEWNFSFSGDWCVFLFDSYRKQSSLDLPLDQSLFSIRHISHSNSEANLRVRLPLHKLSFLGNGSSQIAFSAVLEHPQQQFSYWALTHVATKPDFHQEKSFIVTL